MWLISRLARRGAGRARPPAPVLDAKASRVGPLIAWTQAGRPVWTPRDYAALAREGFQANAVVHRCVRMIAEAAASVPLLLYDGEREWTEHPLLSLLARPNPRDGRATFLEAVYGHLLLAGNAYVEQVAIDGVPRELYALRPDRMKVVPGADGWPEAWDYTVGGKSLRFARLPDGPGVVQPILHLVLFHPLDDHYGLSPIEAAAAAIDIHNAAAAWNKALLDNAARPSGALVYAGANGAVLSDEQVDRLKADLEASFQGAANAGRPLLLEGGLDWKPLSLSPKDMDFTESKAAAAREIALAFGVPPMMLGLPGDNTFANYAEANRSFWRQTVLPLVARTADSLVQWLGPMAERSGPLGLAPARGPRPSAGPGSGPALRLVPDLDRIDALSGEREALWSRIGAADFLSRDEKRQAVGYGAEGGGGKALDIVVHPRSRGEQPRVPSGNPDGGQWTSFLGGIASMGDGFLASLANIGASAVTQVLRHVLQRLIAALRGRGGPTPSSRTLPSPRAPRSGWAGRPTDDILKPGGQAVGKASRGAGKEVRTVDAEEFNAIKSELLRDARQVPGPKDYPGTVYERPDGTQFGVRTSGRSGETIDMINGNNILDNDFKVHQR